MFDPVTVQLSLDRSNVQHEKLVFKLVKPYIPGFSITCNSEEQSITENSLKEQQQQSKRKDVDGKLIKSSNMKKRKKK